MPPTWKKTHSTYLGCLYISDDKKFGTYLLAKIRNKKYEFTLDIEFYGMNRPVCQDLKIKQIHGTNKPLA
jgi:hypothetical protein